MELRYSGFGAGSALIALLAGCGGGAGQAAGVRGQAPTGEVRQVTVTPGGGSTFTVEYEVGDLREAVDLMFEYSEDRGETFQTASGASGTLTLEQTETSGVASWDAAADLGLDPQGDIVVRITPVGQRSGRPGTPAVSAPFPYGGNSAPQVTACAAAASPSGSPVVVRVSARDAQGDTALIAGSYSTDGGATYRDAALTAGGRSTVSLTPAGSSFDLSWDAAGALGEGRFTRVVVRVSIQDASGTDTATSPTFAVTTYRPEVTGITVEDIPAAMNGSTTFTALDGTEQPFQLLLPAYGFSVRVSHAAHPQGHAIDPNSLACAASSALGPHGETPAGTDIGPLFLGNDTEGVLAVTESLRFPPGAATVTATVADLLGNRSLPVEYSFVVEAPGQAVRPFDAADAWLIDFSRDNWTIAGQTADGRVTVSMAFTPNGRADFLDDLALVGLFGEAESALGDRAAALVKERVLVNLREFYGIAPDGTHDADSPGIDFTIEPARGGSAIAAGGADPAGGYTLGRAYFDRGNGDRERDTAASLGIFTTNLIRFYVNTSYAFKEAFDPFIPGRGNPVGTLAEDAVVLGGSFVPGAEGNSPAAEARHADLAVAADAFGRSVAAIAAHEIGHGVGLVANGPPPEGLFGGEENASFSGYWTDPYHIDTPGNNIMEAALSFSVMLYRGSQALRFNEMNAAYLRERILLTR